MLYAVPAAGGEACVTASERRSLKLFFLGYYIYIYIFLLLLLLSWGEGGLFSNRSLIPLMGSKICAEEAENARNLSLFDAFLASRVRLTAELAPPTTFFFLVRLFAAFGSFVLFAPPPRPS